MLPDEFLLRDERVKEEILETGAFGPGWNWYVTSERIVKHREGSGSEELRDVSLDSVSGVGFGTKRNRWLLWFAVVSAFVPTVVVGALLPPEFAEFGSFRNLLVATGAGAGGLVLVAWYFSERAYVEVRTREGEDWRAVSRTPALGYGGTDEEDMKEFAKSLRREVSDVRGEPDEGFSRT